MRGRELDSHSPERAVKRRRVSNSIERDVSHEIMDLSNPTFHLTPLESTLRTLLLDVAAYIQREGITEEGSDDRKYPETVLRFTGGWVRDKLLGVDSHDIDVGISSMTGYQFGMALKDYLDVPENLEKYKQSLPSEELSDAIVSLHKIDANPEKSKHLETVTTKIFGLDIDLVNLRKETYSDDSRNPQMEFGTAEEDALRRDATINALFYNLNESKLEDLTKRGLDDMKMRIIRTPLEPYQTFKDDPLRVLRLIRFASRLGYQIDRETESAMQNEDISLALKLKISKERVFTELDKMLHGEWIHSDSIIGSTNMVVGPDPHGALQFIDRLGLYPTIFANHQDEVTADTSTWPLAYNALARLLQPDTTEAALARVREVLLHDKASHYNAWIIAAFAPWTSVPARGRGTEKRPPPTRPVEVARDSLKADNRTLSILRDATLHFPDIMQCKDSLLGDTFQATPAEIRQRIGLRIRSWGKDWRLCVVLAILQAVMRGRDLADGRIPSPAVPVGLRDADHIFLVVQEYDRFLAYIVEKDLDSVCELKPIVNGADIMQHLGAKKGPWMSRATNLVVEWQLLHPEISDKTVVLNEISERRAELGL